jgi:hypothetical protein
VLTGCSVRKREQKQSQQDPLRTMKKLIDKGESQKLHATPSKPKKKEKEAS